MFLRRLALALFALLVSSTFALAAPSSVSPARARGPAADSLGALIDRWALSVGGRRKLDAVHGAHLFARQTEARVPGTSESWITRDDYHLVVTQGGDHREELRRGVFGWVVDWNQKALALGGRDVRDLVTAAYVKSLLYAGFSAASLRSAGARFAGRDSSHGYQVITLDPAGGEPVEVDLDPASGRPARAVRKPYDDALVLTFEDWRVVGGVSVPFRVLESSEDDSAAVVTQIDSLAFEARIPASRFAVPRDGAPDFRFAQGREARGIPFNYENEHIMIECSVNGSPPSWFMFDTGADVTIINRTRLKAFGLEAFGASTTSGGGNSADFTFTRVDRMDVGGVSMLRQRAGVLDLSGLERLYGMALGGILGYDFASRFVIVVDYDAKRIDLRAADDAVPLRGHVIPFVLERGHPHVRGSITVADGPPIVADFVIDSGAAESANLTAPFVAANHLLERARGTPVGAPSTMAGLENQFFAQSSVRGRLRSIALGDCLLTDIPVNLQQGTRGAYASASFSGTIGQRILQRFTTTYDYPRGMIALEPNGAFGKPFPPRTTFGITLLSDGPNYTTFKVSGVRKDSPAAAAGLQTGDILSSIDGKPASEWRLAGVRAALADEGSRHTLDVLRNGEAVRVPITVRLVSIEDR